MDKRKALFRTKLRESAQKRDKRIDSPLVRYNEYDQPVCRVCNVILKSESLWPAHQASRKHHEAIENVKASAAGLTRGNNVNTEPPAEVQKPRSSSTLPTDFFDKQEEKRQKTDTFTGAKIQSASSSVGSDISDHQQGKKEVSSPVRQSLKVPESVMKTDEQVDSGTKERSEIKESAKLGQPSKRLDDTSVKKPKGALPGNFFDQKERSENQSSRQQNQAPRNTDSLEVKQLKRAPPDDFFDRKEESDSVQSNQLSQPSKQQDNLEAKQVKGALPEGFFDNKDADLRARGIEPVKVDINDAYKEFEKEIQDDLQEVDDRLEEEEIDAAEEREGITSLEQQEYREKVNMVKQKLLEVKAARLARGQNRPAFMGKESSDESSSDDDDGDDDDENFAVDWRAQHL
ncbi:uncharacterized protein [Elaeis guineensis]|uniref:Zinc finger protein 830 isoform X1 n=1 Tax=Elaeis guineensis var. tenera TaxID=51953 RepID=A0A6I9RSV5_ELAGV|nr:zinc finger protein 830 isoform X1 [Elaeis guineensis]XP_010931558.1 zinc finger protein 830 isoform X1 [Elaeis guineensis]